jgi:Na+/glutamate symporter
MIEALLSGLVGVVVGAILTSWLTYRFQKRLLKQQLEANEKTHQELLIFLNTALKDANVQLNQLKDSLGTIAVAANRPPAPRHL